MARLTKGEPMVHTLRFARGTIRVTTYHAIITQIPDAYRVWKGRTQGELIDWMRRLGSVNVELEA